VVPPRTGKPGRPAGPRVVPPGGMCYATVHKGREGGRVASVQERVVFGELPAGARVSTSYLERQTGADRHRNARTGRKTYRVSKGWGGQESMAHFPQLRYKFCGRVRALAP